ncbi:MAG: hypothetical protein SPF41_03335 [Candidatus Merdousia sp.]|nr:hypothetical protein [Candidatus Merdousia sp.]
MHKFLPYYEEIKLLGHFGCAFVSTYLGGVALWFASLASKSKLTFERSFAFSLFASVCVWIVPFYADEEKCIIIAAAILLACLPILKFLSDSKFKTASILWAAYTAAQLAQFGLVYYSLNK